MIVLSNLTRSGVCYDLPNSPFDTGYGVYLLKFSSMSHKDKFDREVHKKELWLNDSLQRRFKCRLRFDLLAALHFYRQVETRGFCVYDAREDRWYTDMQQFTFTLM